MLPDFAFVDSMLIEWRSKGLMLRAQCARCLARGSAEDRFLEKVVCQGCKKKMPARDFGPAELKTLYMGLRTKERWRCFVCKYPACAKCGERPVFAVPHNALESGVYCCMPCRFPPCVVCGKERPQSSKYRVQVMPEWACEDCPKTSAAEKRQLCTDCQQELPISAFTPRRDRKISARCTECLDRVGERCFKCSATRKRSAGAVQTQKGIYFCSDYCKFPPCAAKRCQAKRPKATKYTFDRMTEWFCEKHRR